MEHDRQTDQDRSVTDPEILVGKSAFALAVIERTAGLFRAAAKRPPATIAEERAAFEQAVADEVIASLNR